MDGDASSRLSSRAGAARSKRRPYPWYSASLGAFLLPLTLLLLFSSSAASAPAASASAPAATTNTGATAASSSLASQIELLASGDASAIAAAKAAALDRTLGVVSSIASLVVPDTTVVLPGPQGPYPPVLRSPSSPPENLPMVAFTGSAGLFIFYAGVAQGLIEAGLLVPGVSAMAGLSGGAITAAAVAAGVAPAALLSSYDESPIFCDAALPDDWATGGETRAGELLARFAARCLRTAEWPLRRVANSMRRLIPAEKVADVSRTVQIFASQVNPLDYRSRVASPMGPYSSKEDLVQKISASSDLPCLVSGTSFTVVNTTTTGGGGRGEVGEKPFVDGGFTANFNQLCAGATDRSRCITVTVRCIHREGVRRQEKEKQRLDPRTHSKTNKPTKTFTQALQVGPSALVPLRDALGRCYDNVLTPPISLALPSPYFGWASYPTLPRPKWKVGSEPCDLPDYLKVLTLEDQLVPPGPDLAININPGKRTPLPLTPCEWRSYRLGKANRTVSKLIYDHGVAEARAFAREAYGIS